MPPGTLKQIMLALERIGEKVPLIFPVHPRTRAKLSSEFTNGKKSGLILVEPLGYLDFLALMTSASIVITDSGGIQEETTYLKIPCLTARPNTERPITISKGSNCLVKSDQRALVKAALEILSNETDVSSNGQIPELWDGLAAQRIVDILRGY